MKDTLEQFSQMEGQKFYFVRLGTGGQLRGELCRTDGGFHWWQTGVYSDPLESQEVNPGFLDTRNSPSGNFVNTNGKKERSTQGYSSPRASFIVIAGTVAVMTSTILAIVYLIGTSDNSWQVQLAMGQLEAHAQEINALEWKTMEESAEQLHADAAGVAALQQTQRELLLALSSLSSQTRNSEAVNGISSEIDRYLKAVDQELHLLEAGNFKEAQKIDSEVVDPHFNLLRQKIEETSAEQRQIAGNSNREAKIWLIISSLLSTIAISALFLRFARAKQRAGEALGEITERKRNEEELRKKEAELLRSQAELRALAAQLISAKEEENKRLARDIHDVFSQRLAVLGMELSAVQRQLVSSPLQVTNRLRNMKDEIEKLSQQIHQLSRELHPTTLYLFGLAATLKGACAAFSEQQKVAAKFVPCDVPATLPNEIALSLYRIVQEALWNAAKYAAASEVLVTLAGSGNEIELTVQDDGKGFDLDQSRGRKGGLGLVSMEERARLVGGSFFIHSQPGKGTRVEVRIPVAEQEK